MRTHIAAGEPEAHGPSQPSPEVQGSQQVKTQEDRVRPLAGDSGTTRFT